MEESLIDSRTYDGINFTVSPLARGEYENCTFSGCDFSYTDLSEIKFIDCCFNECNLSLVKLLKTVFRDTQFVGCKMLGLHFDDCSRYGLGFSFEQCTLNYSSFVKTKITKTLFKNSQLQETDFTDCDMTGSIFENCDFLRATFNNTVIEKVDLHTAYNYVIDPENNRIKKARFSLAGVAGLLTKYDIDIDGIN